MPESPLPTTSLPVMVMPLALPSLRSIPTRTLWSKVPPVIEMFVLVPSVKYTPRPAEPASPLSDAFTSVRVTWSRLAPARNRPCASLLMAAMLSKVRLS